MRAIGYVAAAVLILGLWLPWGHLLLGLLGNTPTNVGDVNGQDIGSDVLSLPVGWITAGAGVAGAIGLRGGSRTLAVVASLIALGIAGYSLLAIPGHETTATATGQDVSGVLNAQVSLAWGTVAVTAAAVVLLVAALRAGAEPDAEESFCYLFAKHGEHPTGDGEQYRATVIGPGVTPDVMWSGKPAGTSAAPQADADADAAIKALNDPACKPV